MLKWYVKLMCALKDQRGISTAEMLMLVGIALIVFMFLANVYENKTNEWLTNLFSKINTGTNETIKNLGKP